MNFQHARCYIRGDVTRAHTAHLLNPPAPRSSQTPTYSHCDTEASSVRQNQPLVRLYVQHDVTVLLKQDGVFISRK